MTALGVIFPPDQPPERLRPVALAAERAGLDDLWLWEDCFAEAGVSAAAAVLGWTERIHVGVGLMPVPLRNVALAAMEVATLARLFPGRLLPGIGHGVLEWMGQCGVRAESPMTLLREYGTALHELLAGESVTTSGHYVTLDDVRLAWPPETVPPMLVGAVRPKTLALAGEIGDGLIFTGDTAVDDVRAGVRTATQARPPERRDAPFEVVAFLAVSRSSSPEHVAERVRELAVAGATRVAVLGFDDSGEPERADGLTDFVATLQRAAAQLG